MLKFWDDPAPPPPSCENSQLFFGVYCMMIMKLGGHMKEHFSKYFTILRNLVLSISTQNLHGSSFCKKTHPKYLTLPHLLKLD